MHSNNYTSTSLHVFPIPSLDLGRNDVLMVMCLTCFFGMLRRHMSAQLFCPYMRLLHRWDTLNDTESPKEQMHTVLHIATQYQMVSQYGIPLYHANMLKSVESASNGDTLQSQTSDSRCVRSTGCLAGSRLAPQGGCFSI